MTDKMNLNLLPSQAKFQAKKVLLKQKARLVMVLMLIIWLVAIVTAVGVELVANTRLKTLEASKTRAQAGVSAMSEQAVVNQNLKYKSKLVGKALSQRFEYGKAFEKINSIFPEGILLSSFELESRGKFKVSGKTTGAENVNKLEKLVASINNGENENFLQIQMQNLAVKGGVWSFEMEALLR